MKRYVLIVSAGEGQRMDTGIPKQFVRIHGLPLLMHTIHAFTDINAELILVLNQHRIEQWEEMCRNYGFSIPHQVVAGGPKRFYSVKSGLNAVPDEVLVAIHDGVRPLVSRKTIDQAFIMAENKGSGVPSVLIHESVRLADRALNKPIDRSKLRIIQTPQVFRSSELKKAYHQNYDESFTDDATVMESAGYPVHLSEGNPENIKVTYPHDLRIAEALLKKPV